LSAIQFSEGPRVSADRLRQLGFQHKQLELRVRFADGSEQGFDFGPTNTGEGVTLVRRLQDDTVWGVNFTASSRFFKFRNELTERRLIPELMARAVRFE